MLAAYYFPYYKYINCYFYFSKYIYKYNYNASYKVYLKKHKYYK